MTDLHTLPLGVFSPPGGHPRVGVRLGDDVVDIAALAALIDSPFTDILAGETLDPLLAAGRPVWEALRAQLLDWRDSGAFDRWLIPLVDVALHLPWTVGDYVDFYASEHHAAAVGRIFRPGQPPLPKAWRHLPQGYHGRSGTVVVSGTPVRRPNGLRWADDGQTPMFGPTRRLDVEVELGFVVGGPEVRGTPIDTLRYRDHVFGFVLVNDWSARDIQGFETVPLGPQAGKSFATSVSPWVVQLDAIESWRFVGSQLQQPRHEGSVADNQQDRLAAYLVEHGSSGMDLRFQLSVNGGVLTEPPYAEMFWSPAQMLAQLAVNGGSVRPGDLFASGTVSGPEPRQEGSLLELWRGERFLADGDEVTISASAVSPDHAGRSSGERLDLGAVSGTVRPALG